MKIIFLAYRDWAIKVFETIKKNPKVTKIIMCNSMEELLTHEYESYDLLMTCGWSEELGAEVTTKIQSIGLHCAELDRYSYGSPIQLQIIDGIKFTKHRVFSFTYDRHSDRAHTHNRLFSHEVDLDLSGNMEDILFQMHSTGIVLFNMFLDDYPSIKWNEWPKEEVKRTKRNPINSRLTKDDLVNMDTEQMYNFFRCLEDPYPNGYIEDEKGTLIINKVHFKSKEVEKC